jgi:hypothetical protein
VREASGRVSSTYKRERAAKVFEDDKFLSLKYSLGCGHSATFAGVDINK